MSKEGKTGEAKKPDIIIGLEVHAELATKTKLFCSCPRVGSEEPNTRTCPVCLGHPGSKPVLNKKALEYAMRLALATGCSIAPELVFSRKSYFYPDMSKNFQISQHEMPLGEKGKVRLSSGKDIKLTRIHMEEDPAALIHPSGMGSSNFVLVDYNRSGNPLIEIVTEPDMHGPEEARDFMKQLLTVLRYLKIFDIDSCVLKADANISIKESGYTRVEVKNITGFKEIERALVYEVERHKARLKEGKTIASDTRAWDADKGMSRSMRLKESEEDYGYIFEPDLARITLGKGFVEKVKADIPELAHDKAKRYVKDFGIKKEDSLIISAQLELAELYEKVAEKIDPVLAAKWLRRELARVMNYNNLDFSDLQIDESHLIELLSMIEKKEITDKVGQKILEKLMEEPFDVREHVEKNGLKTAKDSGSLEKICKKTVDENQKVVEDYKSGNDKSFNFLVGQVMRETKGTADPKDVREKIKRLL